MLELIDKKRTEAKVFLIARLFIDRPDREVELVKAVIHRCCEEIDKQPTLEAEPVRHGRWIEDGEICGINKYKCSLCGGEVGGLLDNTKYCCFCGAKMDGGAKK